MTREEYEYSQLPMYELKEYTLLRIPGKYSEYGKGCFINRGKWSMSFPKKLTSLKKTYFDKENIVEIYVKTWFVEEQNLKDYEKK